MTALHYRLATQADAGPLADLRVAAMRDSLIAAGRFDEDRARARLLDGFNPALTICVLRGGDLIGFYVLRPVPDGSRLDHFYLHPDHSGHGCGAQVMARIIAQAGGDITLGALKASPVNRFYLRHGFVPTHQDQHDIYYHRRGKA